MVTCYKFNVVILPLAVSHMRREREEEEERERERASMKARACSALGHFGIRGNLRVAQLSQLFDRKRVVYIVGRDLHHTHTQSDDESLATLVTAVADCRRMFNRLKRGEEEEKERLGKAKSGHMTDSSR